MADQRWNEIRALVDLAAERVDRRHAMDRDAALTEDGVNLQDCDGAR